MIGVSGSPASAKSWTAGSRLSTRRSTPDCSPAARTRPTWRSLTEEAIPPIDLVCVSLYPFEQTIARRDVGPQEAIENIDIGGPTMIRAAAKNHGDVVVLVKPECYDAVIEEMNQTEGEVSPRPATGWPTKPSPNRPLRRRDLGLVFQSPRSLPRASGAGLREAALDLSYGENPHQRAALYSQVGLDSNVLTGMSKHHGKALSFNNVLDLDACRKLLADLEGPACVIVSTTTPAGSPWVTRARRHERARDCDPVSAFGGVIAINQVIDVPLARPFTRTSSRYWSPLVTSRKRWRSSSRRRTSASSPTRPRPSPTHAKRTSSGSAAAS